MTEEQRKKRRERDRARYRADPEKFRAVKRAEYRENPEKFLARGRKFREENPELVRAQERKRARSSYAENPEKAAAYQKGYRAGRRALFRARNRAYRAENREKILEKQRARYREAPEKFLQKQRARYSQDPAFRLVYCVRRRISNAIRECRAGTRKAGTSIKLLGCSFAELKAHVEQQFLPGMSWENHNKTGWHLDHKRPCASFDLTQPEQQRQCFHYTNLQPLWAEDNLAKGDKWGAVA